MTPPMMRKSCLLPEKLPRIALFGSWSSDGNTQMSIRNFVELLCYACLSTVTWNNLSPTSPQGEDGICRHCHPLWKTYSIKVWKSGFALMGTVKLADISFLNSWFLKISLPYNIPVRNKRNESGILICFSYRSLLYGQHLGKIFTDKVFIGALFVRS